MATAPKNYHLVGFAYSGKTALAKALESDCGFARISIDELKAHLGYADAGDDDVPDEIWARIFEEADESLVRHLKQGRNVANEYAWATRYWRDRSRHVAAQAGYETIFVHLQVPEPEIRRRWAENEISRVRFHMPKVEFDRMFGEFEALGPDEKVVVCPGLLDVPSWVRRVAGHGQEVAGAAEGKG